MKGKKMTVERDREATEKRLLDTIGEMIANDGFEKIGINAVAAQSGVSKILIYRYFDSVEGLMAAYIRQNDFWLNLPIEMPTREQVPAFLKHMFKEHIKQLRANPTLKRLYRWELSSDNELIVKLREQREFIGVNLIKMVTQLTGMAQEEVAALASFEASSIVYLVMLEDFCPVYNGIPINTDEGWEQIYRGIEFLIDKVFQDWS